MRKSGWSLALLATAALALPFAGAAEAPEADALLKGLGVDADVRLLKDLQVPANALSVRTQRTGNVIFIHPDGTGLNTFGAARVYWEGPDGALAWDRLPYQAAYRGHMRDRVTGTSNGGATVHAFGYKVFGPGSFGLDGDREILALSGYAGSILREAANAGHPVGLVNDGDLPEPGTGCFYAEVLDRGLSNEIARQLLDGRPGFEGEPRPVVALGGGERFFLPEGTPMCSDTVTPECAVHMDPVNGRGPDREDGRNLVAEFIDAGYEVLRTRAEFEDFRARLIANPEWTPRVLGLFAADDMFNDTREETLLANGLIDESMAGTKEGRLLTYGSLPGTLGYNPPTAGEMGEVALEILDRHSRAMGKPFLLISEVEATDNFGNNNNAIGTLVGARNADALIAASLDYLERNPNTMIITAADSDGGGMQLDSPASSTFNNNPTNNGDETVRSPLDGVEGRGSANFVAEPDQFGTVHEFTIAWSGTPDVYGGIMTRAAGLNAELLQLALYERFDNVDIYRMMYLTLFGEALPYPQGQLAPSR